MVVGRIEPSWLEVANARLTEVFLGGVFFSNTGLSEWPGPAG